MNFFFILMHYYLIFLVIVLKKKKTSNIFIVNIIIESVRTRIDIPKDILVTSYNIKFLTIKILLVIFIYIFERKNSSKQFIILQIEHTFFYSNIPINFILLRNESFWMHIVRWTEFYYLWLQKKKIVICSKTAFEYNLNYLRIR